MYVQYYTIQITVHGYNNNKTKNKQTFTMAWLKVMYKDKKPINERYKIPQYYMALR